MALYLLKTIMPVSMMLTWIDPRMSLMFQVLMTAVSVKLTWTHPQKNSVVLSQDDTSVESKHSSSSDSSSDELPILPFPQRRFDNSTINTASGRESADDAACRLI